MSWLPLHSLIILSEKHYLPLPVDALLTYLSHLTAHMRAKIKAGSNKLYLRIKYAPLNTVMFPVNISFFPLTFYSLAVSYVPPGLTFKNSAWCSRCVECFVRISEQRASVALYIIKWLVFWPWWKVFTALYELSTTQSRLRLVFQRLTHLTSHPNERYEWVCGL